MLQTQFIENNLSGELRLYEVEVIGYATAISQREEKLEMNNSGKESEIAPVNGVMTMKTKLNDTSTMLIELMQACR